MGGRTRFPGMDAPTFVWCGRLAFAAQRVRGLGHDPVEITLQVDTVEVCLDGRRIGVTDRGRLRLWLARPTQPYRCDDVELTWQAGRIWMTTCTSQRYGLPSNVAVSLCSRA